LFLLLPLLGFVAAVVVRAVDETGVLRLQRVVAFIDLNGIIVDVDTSSSSSFSSSYRLSYSWCFFDLCLQHLVLFVVLYFFVVVITVAVVVDDDGAVVVDAAHAHRFLNVVVVTLHFVAVVVLGILTLVVLFFLAQKSFCSFLFCCD